MMQALASTPIQADVVREDELPPEDEASVQQSSQEEAQRAEATKVRSMHIWLT